MKRLIRLGLGWTFVVLGVVGLVLPFLQGILFLAIGFALIAPESPWAQDKLARVRRRYPQMASAFDRGQVRAEALIAKLKPGRSV